MDRSPCNSFFNSGEGPISGNRLTLAMTPMLVDCSAQVTTNSSTLSPFHGPLTLHGKDPSSNTRKDTKGPRKKGNRFCIYCKMNDHYVDTCYKLYGCPKHANLSVVPSDVVSDSFPVTRQDINIILQLLERLQFSEVSNIVSFTSAETVIYRIFYYINRAGNGRLTLRELKRGNLIASMQHADEEEDINKVLRYFSYEHFYVIYCKFWELDTDHDFFIDKENLIRYGNHALTYRIVERVFSQVPRKFTSKVEGKMGYEDFVYFMLAEEDKSSEPSLEYWFKCIDLDGNGVITPNEMQFFYEEQLHRMECMAQEPVLFEDILCQMFDMIGPQIESHFTLRNLKGCRLSGNVFNILFNLNKFMAFETRDPFLIRQEREDPTLTEWDRFARREYIRLSMEEDGEDASNGSAEVWDESLEAPF